MSILDHVLQEEYERSERIKKAMEEELSHLQKGYISKKRISSKDYFYLQKREGSKIIGKYIAPEDLPNIIKEVEKRRQLEKSIKDLERNMKKLRRVTKI